MIQPKQVAAGVAALVTLGAAAAPSHANQLLRKRRAQGRAAVSRAELAEVIKPGRLIYNTSRRRRRLSFESVIKQAMDRKYSQAMLDDLAKVFWAKKYRPVVLQLDGEGPPVVVEVDAMNGDDLGSGRPPPPGIEPGSEGGFKTLPGETRAPGMGDGDGADTSRLAGLARDLENGIHNEILRTMKEKGYNLVALNVFAQTMDLVKVIMIVATRDLPDHQIRPTLRTIRSIIENEVLAAKFPGVHLAELSSFTLLNERDNHFYEHPVLYWQLKDPKWQGGGGGPIVPGEVAGEAPVVGGVSAGPSDDYFKSGEFTPEEDFNEMELLQGPAAGF